MVNEIPTPDSSESEDAEISLVSLLRNGVPTDWIKYILQSPWDQEERYEKYRQHATKKDERRKRKVEEVLHLLENYDSEMRLKSDEYAEHGMNGNSGQLREVLFLPFICHSDINSSIALPEMNKCEIRSIPIRLCRLRNQNTTRSRKTRTRKPFRHQNHSNTLALPRPVILQTHPPPNPLDR